MLVVEVAGPTDTVAQLSMQPWSSRYIEGTFAKDFCLLTQLTREQRAKKEDSFASVSTSPLLPLLRVRLLLELQGPANHSRRVFRLKRPTPLSLKAPS